MVLVSAVFVPFSYSWEFFFEIQAKQNDVHSEVKEKRDICNSEIISRHKVICQAVLKLSNDFFCFVLKLNSLSSCFSWSFINYGAEVNTNIGIR